MFAIPVKAIPVLPEVGSIMMLFPEQVCRALHRRESSSMQHYLLLNQMGYDPLVLHKNSSGS